MYPSNFCQLSPAEKLSKFVEDSKNPESLAGSPINKKPTTPVADVAYYERCVEYASFMRTNTVASSLSSIAPPLLPSQLYSPEPTVTAREPVTPAETKISIPTTTEAAPVPHSPTINLTLMARRTSRLAKHEEKANGLSPEQIVTSREPVIATSVKTPQRTNVPASIAHSPTISLTSMATGTSRWSKAKEAKGLSPEDKGLMRRIPSLMISRSTPISPERAKEMEAMYSWPISQPRVNIIQHTTRPMRVITAKDVTPGHILLPSHWHFPSPNGARATDSAPVTIPISTARSPVRVITAKDVTPGHNLLPSHWHFPIPNGVQATDTAQATIPKSTVRNPVRVITAADTTPRSILGSLPKSFFRPQT